ncbi:glycosyltransferase family 9 protein [Aliidiomarina quisquiliarum]|uniref:glycosyltransferase family 9 protein n=1 Tax=Aliidiomarina quisquiliarum TaxID=2938947 RepID=UPI00208E76F0|nr:glycosyltransferase family 9 protein [Aliidiomarina quisquiliarum]MCO4320527.1 glycosyltransferase family 9 protein [Aliidiomarina quisquiliarum]
MQLGKPLTASEQSICILRLSAIGDVCHAVATVQAIQRHYPATHITWIVGKVEAMLLANLPGIELVVFDKNLGMKAFSDLKNKLKGRKFDVLLHMQVALRANIASLAINAKRKIGFDKARSKELHSLFMRERVVPQNQAHVLENFAGFARHIGVPFLTTTNEKPNWRMPLAETDIQWARNLLKPFRELGQQRFLVISPAASKAERNWLPERYAAIADYASEQGFQVVLCGGPSAMETQLRDDILKHTQANILDVVGKTSLKQLLALLQQASLVIAPDTGPAHMAVTVGTPVIGLYGHSNPARTGPYLYQHYVVEAYYQELQRQTGKTVAELPFGTRVKGEHIMANISVNAVKAMFDKVIKEENL